MKRVGPWRRELAAANGLAKQSSVLNTQFISERRAIGVLVRKRLVSIVRDPFAYELSAPCAPQPQTSYSGPCIIFTLDASQPARGNC